MSALKKLKPRVMNLEVITPNWWVVNNWLARYIRKDRMRCLVIPLTDDCVHDLAKRLCRAVERYGNTEKALAEVGIKAARSQKENK